MFLYILLGVVAVVLLYLYQLYRRTLNPPTERVDLKQFQKKFTGATASSDFYDVVIVGAGPSGATAAFYLAKAGKKVLLLDKKKFPRDKICGDACVKLAIEILMEMGIYGELIRTNKAHVADYGGIVSPGGLSYIGHSHEQLGEIPGAVGIKRIILDHAIVKAASGAGANLKEEITVTNAVLDKETGLWTVSVEESSVQYKGRVLLSADGSTSKLGIQLGLIKDPPKGLCSRAYIKGGTHKFKADGVMFYRADQLPGYGVLFRHPNDDLNYCCYIIPGNPKLTNDDLPYWHHHLLNEDPNISRAVGKNADIERMKVAPYRYGGEKCTYGDHVLIIGDAAGFVDPMTGEGIHTAMDSGRIAAKFLCEAFEVGNFDKELMKEYQNRWLSAWGHDFKWSQIFVQMMYRHPIILDAFAAAIIRKGEKFLARWADIMTGRIPKVNLLRPEFIIVLGYEMMILLFKKYLGGGYAPVTKKTL